MTTAKHAARNANNHREAAFAAEWERAGMPALEAAIEAANAEARAIAETQYVHRVDAEEMADWAEAQRSAAIAAYNRAWLALPAWVRAHQLAK